MARAPIMRAPDKCDIDQLRPPIMHLTFSALCCLGSKSEVGEQWHTRGASKKVSNSIIFIWRAQKSRITNCERIFRQTPKSGNPRSTQHERLNVNLCQSRPTALGRCKDAARQTRLFGNVPRFIVRVCVWRGGVQRSFLDHFREKIPVPVACERVDRLVAYKSGKMTPGTRTAGDYDVHSFTAGRFRCKPVWESAESDGPVNRSKWANNALDPLNPASLVDWWPLAWPF